jgi:hypothetical protein
VSAPHRCSSHRHNLHSPFMHNGSLLVSFFALPACVSFMCVGDSPSTHARWRQGPSGDHRWGLYAAYWTTVKTLDAAMPVVSSMWMVLLADSQ